LPFGQITRIHQFVEGVMDMIALHADGPKRFFEFGRAH
jgi:hypothetical protein